VLATDPPPGQQVPINSAVQLTVSTGNVAVPKVVGMTVDQAVQALQQAGFQVVLNPQASPGDAHVVSQDPAPGSFAKYGSTVRLQTDAPPPTPTQSPTPSTSPSPSETPSTSPSSTPT